MNRKMCGTQSESRRSGEEKNPLLLSGLEERTTPQSLRPQLLSTDTPRLKKKQLRFGRSGGSRISRKPEISTEMVDYVCMYVCMYRGADKSLARPGRKQATATEDFDIHISYLLS